MLKQLNHKQLVILLLFICFPFLRVAKSEDLSCLCSKKVYSYSTDLRISSVNLNLLINADGTYYGNFYGFILGSNETENGTSNGSFIVPDTTVTNFTFYIEENSFDLERTEENESIVFSFSINQSIPENLQCRMRGSFYGNCQSNNSGIFSYSLGIDWGTSVGKQTSIIRMKFRDYNIIEVSPDQHTLQVVGEYFELQWFETMVQGFATELKIQSTEIPISEILEITPPSPWNVTAGKDFEIKVKNIAIYDIEVFIILPRWITTYNVTKFYLKPNEEIEVTFHISSQVPKGMNDSIQFVSVYFSTFYKPVIVIRAEPTNLPFFLIAMASFIIAGAVFSYFYRENLQEFIQKVKHSSRKFKDTISNSEISPNNFLHDKTLTTELDMWDSIKNRWEPILPENEFKVLETLFFNGTINQQTIAEELDMSQMTVSRLVSRLESKQLLTKKRSGMSNMIILNIDRL